MSITSRVWTRWYVASAYLVSSKFMLMSLSLLRVIDLTHTSKLSSTKYKTTISKLLPSLTPVKEYRKVSKWSHLRILWVLQEMFRLFSTLLIMRRKRKSQVINCSNFCLILKIIQFTNQPNKSLFQFSNYWLVSLVRFKR